MKSHVFSFGLFFVLLLSIISWYLSYTAGLTTVYNDAMSHLDLARLVLDNAQPGFSQLGGVWLPFNHLLSLTLIWNDWAWHSGFAGSFYSMLSYILSVAAVFSLVRAVTKNTLAACFAGFVLSTNVNLLYL